MKSIVTLGLILCCTYLAINLLQDKDASSPSDLSLSTSSINEPPLSIVFFQDVSGSIKKNGVQLVESSVFTPYFDEIHRNIELSFGVIDSLSAGKLITLTLPARNFTQPELQDFRKLSITEIRNEKERFIKADSQYKEDSIQFYTDRRQRINAFCDQVDSLLAPYRRKLSKHTDLSTAIEIADRVFAFSKFESTENHLLLNSDGQDSYGRNISALEHKADIILINAGRNEPTSIDSLIPIRLQAPEQAILYSLHHKKH